MCVSDWKDWEQVHWWSSLKKNWLQRTREHWDLAHLAMSGCHPAELSLSNRPVCCIEQYHCDPTDWYILSLCCCFLTQTYFTVHSLSTETLCSDGFKNKVTCKAAPKYRNLTAGLNSHSFTIHQTFFNMQILRQCLICEILGESPKQMDIEAKGFQSHIYWQSSEELLLYRHFEAWTDRE